MALKVLIFILLVVIISYGIARDRQLKQKAKRERFKYDELIKNIEKE